MLVGLASREPLPRADDLSERVSRHHTEQDMHVVGHNCPSVHSITGPVEREKRILDLPGNRLCSQPTGAPTLIEHFVTRCLWPVHILEPGQCFGRKAIHQPKRDKLDHVL